MNSRKKLIRQLIVCIISFCTLMGVGAAFAVDELEVRAIEKMDVGNSFDRIESVTFNPKANKLRLFSAKEQGFPEGGTVEDITKTTNALVTMNAGYFTEGSHRSNSRFGAVMEKLCYYTSIGKNYAFPSAILIVNNKLLSDTDSYMPALGVDDLGEIKFGEVKVIWYATLSENGKKIILDRASEINPDDKNIAIYYRRDPSTFVGITISGNKVIDIGVVQKEEIKTRVPNGYWLHEPSSEVIDDFKSLQVGDYLNVKYELEAVALSEEKGTQKKDDALSAFFNKCSNVVSGGQLIMYNGEEDPRISKLYNGRQEVYEKFGSIVCVQDEETVSLVAAASGELPKNELIKYLKTLKCQHAISMDGGRSTTLVTRIGGEEILFGHNRVVSDILAIMPKT